MLTLGYCVKRIGDDVRKACTHMLAINPNKDVARNGIHYPELFAISQTSLFLYSLEDIFNQLPERKERPVDRFNLDSIPQQTSNDLGTVVDLSLQCFSFKN